MVTLPVAATRRPPTPVLPTTVPLEPEITEQLPNTSNPAGFIRRVARPKALAAESRDGVDFAQAGIWYDALESLSDEVDDHPNDRKARFLRSALLRQVKLDAAVE